jgi:hypothetical protein
MASANFTNLPLHIANARVDWGTDTFKAVLVTSVPTGTNLDEWEYLDDVTNEVSAGGGYTAGGFAVTAAIGALDTTDDRVAITYSAASPTYAASTITARGCVIYMDTEDEETSPVLHFVDFGESKVSTDGNFTVTFDTPFYVYAGIPA